MLKAFLCYSRQDAREVDRLEAHLAILNWVLKVDLWRDTTDLRAGNRWSKDVEKRIKESEIFILALTPDFFQSSYIKNNELPAILVQSRIRKVLIFPVVLKACQYQFFLTGDLEIQAMPVDRVNRRVTAITSPVWYGEDGYDAAVEGIGSSIKAHFNISEDGVGPQSRAGLEFAIASPTNDADSYGTIASSTDAGDYAAAQAPLVQQLYAGASQRIRSLHHSVLGLGNQHTWARLVTSVADLDSLLSSSIDDLTDRLVEAWLLLQSLSAAQARDDALLIKATPEDSPLAPSQRMLLDESLAIAGALLGCFPAIANIIQPSLTSVLGGQTPHDIAQSLFEEALSQDLLDTGSAEYLKRIIQYGRAEGKVAANIRGILQPSSRNLGFFILAIAASTIVSATDHPSPLQEKATKFARSQRELLLSANSSNRIVQTAISVLNARLNKLAGVAGTVAPPQSSQEAESLSSIREGQVFEGVVKRFVGGAAFVDIGGIQGFLHVNDIAWQQLNEPQDALEIGQKVRVKVLRFLTETQHPAIGMKQLSADPWPAAIKRYMVGSRLSGTVKKIIETSATVELEPGIDGIVNLFDISWKYRPNVGAAILLGEVLGVEEPTVSKLVGRVVDVLVLKVDTRLRRIRLGMKQRAPNPWDDFRDAFPVGTVLEGRVSDILWNQLVVSLPGGLQGYVRSTDISGQEAPGEALRKYRRDERITFKVLDINKEEGKVFLGIKQLIGEPSKDTRPAAKVGVDVPVVVCAATESGLQVAFRDDGTPGFIPKRELHVNDNEKRRRKYVIGENLRAKVTSFDPLEQVVILSLRAVDDEMAKARANRPI